MDNTQYQEVYDFMAKHAESVDLVIGRIISSTWTKDKSGVLSLSKSGLLFTEGIPGPTPGVEGEGWRPYTPEEITAMESCNEKALSKYEEKMTHYHGLTHEEFGESFAVIAQLHQVGLLGWVNYGDDDNGLDNYSANPEFVATLMPGVVIPVGEGIDKHYLCPLKADSLSVREEAVFEDMDLRLARYERLKVNVGNRDPIKDTDLIAVDEVVAQLYKPR